MLLAVKMWLFGRKPDTKTSQPVQRQICIRTRNGVDDQAEPVTTLGTTTANTSNGFMTTLTTSRLNSSFRQTVTNSFGRFRFGGGGGDNSTIGGEEDGNAHGGGGDDDDEEDDNSDSDSKSTSSSLSGTKYSGNRGTNGKNMGTRSYLSYNREPLDARTWSNVTSPGFSSRVVQQANGYGSDDMTSNNLRTFTQGGPTMNRSSFSRSPNGSLRLGQLPVAAVPKRTTSTLLSFPSPNKGSSYLSYNRFSRVHKRDRNGSGTIFVKLAPVDLKSLPVAPVSPNGAYSSSFGDRDQYFGVSTSRNGMGGSGSGSSTPTSPGLGGIPHATLTQRFSRLWPDKPPSVKNIGPPTTGGYLGASPNINIADMLNNRKRGRDLDVSLNASVMADTNKSFNRPGPSTPNKSIMSPEDQAKFTKRVKYVSEQDLRHHSNRPLNLDAYHHTPSGNDSKSILEQMNQTEKRFFPDSAPVTSPSKRTRILGSPSRPCSTSTPLPSSGIRKRKGGENGISAVEFDENEIREDPKTKTGKFCHCNECYAEAAGSSQNVASPISHSPVAIYNSPRKMVTFNQPNSPSMNSSMAMCDKGTETEMEVSRPDIIIRNAASQGSIITKEKYEYDRVKRLERFKRILGLDPPKKPADQPDPTDMMDGANKLAPPVPTSSTSMTPTVGSSSAQVTTTVTTTTAAFSSSVAAVTPLSTGMTEIKPAFQFGVTPQTTTTSTGFNFGTPTTSASSESPLLLGNTNEPLKKTGEQPNTTDVMDGIAKSAPLVPISNESTIPTFSSPTTQATTTVASTTLPSSVANLSTVASETQPGFQFGVTSKSTNSGFNFGTPTTTTTSSAAPLTVGNTGSSDQPSLAINPSTTANNNTSGFGSVTTTTSTLPSFGLTSSSTTSQPFGGGTTAASTFGAVPPATNSNSIFGSPATQTTTSLQFGQKPAQAQPPASNGGIQPAFQFGGAPQTTNTGFNFGTPTSASSSSASPLTLGNTTGSSGQQSTNLFINPSTTASSNNISGFGSVTTTTSTPTLTTFGSSVPTTTSQPFGSTAAPAFGAPPSTNSNPIFGAQSAPQTASPFQFGQTQAQTQPQAANGGFNFGQPTGAQPAVQFGATPQSGISAGFNFASPAASGGTAAQAAPTVPSFGSVAPLSTAVSETQPFQFGDVPKTTNSGFNFGTPTTTSASVTAPLSFGNTSSSGQQSSNLFNIPSNNNNTSGFGSVAPTASTLPTFGSSTTSQGFGGGGTAASTFGAVSSTNSNSIFGSPAPQTTTPYQFGQKPAQSQPPASNAGFGFGQTAPGGTQPAFQFGGAPASQSTNSGLNFGTPATTSASSASPFSLGNTNNNSGQQSSNLFNMNPSTTSNNTSGFGSFTTTSSNISTFGSPALSNTSFGGGGAPPPYGAPATNSNPIFGSPAPQTATPFQFGQTQAQTQPQASNGGFNFGQAATQPGTQPVFQFGGAPAPQAGGFNFASQAANTDAGGGNAMFSVGQGTSQAQRRRPIRRYR